MDAIGRQIGVKMTHELLGLKKQGFFPGPVIRILPLDPMGGDGTGCSPVGRGLRRGGGCSHRGFMLVGGVLVAEKGEFRHTIFLEPPFWGDLRQTGVDTWFKMYANGRYWEASDRSDRSISPRPMRKSLF